MKTFVSLVPQFTGGIYYRAGDTGVFPDDWQPPKGKKKWIPVGDAAEEVKRESQNKQVEKEIEAIVKRHKIDHQVLEAVYKEKGAESPEEKLIAAQWLAEELKKDTKK